MDLHFNTRTHEVRDHARAKQRANFIDTRRERSRSTTDIERALDLLGTAAAQHFIPVLAVDMPRVTTRSEQYLAIGAGLTIATASIVSLYLVSQNIHRQDYARRRWRRTQSSMTAGKQQHGGTFGRAPPATRIPSTAGGLRRARPRYAEDGRRRLPGSADSRRDEDSDGGMEAYRRGGDARGRALSSSDVLLHVFSFLDRRQVIKVGGVSVTFHRVATDDTIWAGFVKTRITQRLIAQHAGVTLGRKKTLVPDAFFSEAGLGRVVEFLYMHLPRAYVELYPRSPPTGGIPARGGIRKSWHRFYLTMDWVRDTSDLMKSEERAAAGGKEQDIKLCQETLRPKRPMIKRIREYGKSTIFPEQVISFIWSLFCECCEDYWSELVGYTPAFGASDTQPPQSRRSQVPAWGDMFAVLHGYLRLFRGRRFLNMTDNMGFLLQAPIEEGSTAVRGGENADEAGSDREPLAPKRELQIPCTLKMWSEALKSTAPGDEDWPYKKAVTLDDIMEYFPA